MTRHSDILPPRVKDQDVILYWEQGTWRHFQHPACGRWFQPAADEVPKPRTECANCGKTFPVRER